MQLDSSLSDTTQILSLVATRRFMRDEQSFSRKYPAFKDLLRDFCEFKTKSSRSESFNVKDGRLTAGMKRLSRCHLIHGKAVLVYAFADATIQLITVTDHDGIEGKSAMDIVNYFRGLSESDFEPFDDILRSASEPIQDSFDVSQLKREVERLSAEAKRTENLVRQLEGECAGAWSIAEEEAEKRAQAERQIQALRVSSANRRLDTRTWSDQLRDIRQRHGWSQSEVGRPLGLSQPQISLAERGVSVPPYVSAVLIAWVDSMASD